MSERAKVERMREVAREEVGPRHQLEDREREKEKERESERE